VEDYPNWDVNDCLLPCVVRLPGEKAPGVKYTSMSTSHMLVVDLEGSMYSCGKNSNSQLGLGDTRSRGSLSKIDSAEKFKFVCCGIVHSVAVTVQGKVYSWGWNYYGQLGLGDKSNRSTPALISALPECHYVSAGGMVNIAIDFEGNLYFWGASSTHIENFPGIVRGISTPVKFSNFRYAVGHRVKSADFV